MAMSNTMEPATASVKCKPVEQYCFPHPVSERTLIETHISCVILTGEFAYKIKKDVDFGFVDYTTLERRKQFCELEVELNRRFAPELYLGVVPVIRVGDKTYVGEFDTESTGGEIANYAVKMKQFPQSAILANRLNDPSLTAEAVEQFGRYVANFHATIESAIPTMEFCQPPQVLKDAGDNFAVLLEPLKGDSRFNRLKRLQLWNVEEGISLCPKMEKRLTRGLVKRCHGDLHLKNIIQHGGQLLAFDGIEFNEQFQYVDVLSEIAFPIMDFVARGRSDLAWRLLNSYLEATGNFEDLDVLRFYLVYRAMVRAKVAWLNPRNHTEERRAEFASVENPNDPFAGPWDKYIATAEYFAFGLTPKLSITHGFSGSGKSTVAMRVIDAEGGIRIRSDVLRQRYALRFQVTDKYSREMNEWVYASLEELAGDGVLAGFPITADATFLKFNRREAFQRMAISLGVPFEIINCEAPFEELCSRLEARVDDPSDANVDVLKLQLANHDPLTDEERQYVR